MREITWTEVGDSTVAELQYGRIVISPTDPPDTYRPYTVRIETRTGKSVATNKFDLETCKIWAQVNLPLMDQASGKLRGCGNVVQTLEMCQELLAHDTHEADAIHWLRIEHIKGWIGKYIEQPYEIASIVVPQYSVFELDWVEEGPIFYAATPHGRAVVEETREKGIIGGGIRHKARIEHYTGAVLDCYSFIDFMEAEAELKNRLRALNSPVINLDCIRFTLDICARVLPDDSDPIHYARLEMLEGVIHSVLD